MAPNSTPLARAFAHFFTNSYCRLFHSYFFGPTHSLTINYEIAFARYRRKSAKIGPLQTKELFFLWIFLTSPYTFRDNVMTFTEAT
jgi:hypothetical protein